jgi:GNAT superfamily N-acetyltransferase
VRRQSAGAWQDAGVTGYTLRPAMPDDLDFITNMMIEAINWKPGRDFTRAQVADDPEISHYLDGWMRPTDFGLIAIDDAGEPIGACWLRYFSADDPSYGYIADDVPELNISVVAGWRGKGVGRTLVRGVLAAARDRRIARIGLSVEHGNYAAKLYYTEGFTLYETTGDADTLVIETAKGG